MKIDALWKKLFSRNKEADEIALHISGATIRHRNPFEDLEVPRNEEELTEDFADRWIMPFCMYGFASLDESLINEFARASRQIDIEIVLKLLGDFDWRPRLIGAYFAAINNYTELSTIIGHSLLKSEVCYAGAGYCLALAKFNSDAAKDFLKEYLDYYLDKKDLWFNQNSAYCALHFIDPNSSDLFIDKWNAFIDDKPNWNFEKSKKHFDKEMKCIDEIQKVATNHPRN